jgi:SagB-type dehydrogenase family enzyme
VAAGAARKPGFRELEPALRAAVARRPLAVPEAEAHRIESAARPDLPLRELSRGLQLPNRPGARERQLERRLAVLMERDFPERRGRGATGSTCGNSRLRSPAAGSLRATRSWPTSCAGAACMFASAASSSPAAAPTSIACGSGSRSRRRARRGRPGDRASPGTLRRLKQLRARSSGTPWLTNWDLAAVSEYHEHTKHSFESVRRSARPLDWDNRPHPFKEYLGLEARPLPRELAHLLRWGAGVVRTRTLPDGDVYSFRTYSSAGALYPVEVYLACAELEGLQAGVYHFHPRELALRQLRRGDVRSALAEAAVAPELSEAAAVLVLTGIHWRSAWKYQARAYRHLFWDAGTMLANLLALASAGGIEARLLTGFVDAQVDRLVGAGGEREWSLALLALGRAASAPPCGELEPLQLGVAPLSHREVAYPLAAALHAASCLTDADDVWRYRAPAKPGAVAPSPPDWGKPLETVLRRRGSIRDFSPRAVLVSTLAAILDHAAAPIPADAPPCNEIFVIANAVEGLEPGVYRFRPPDGFELVRAGSFRREAGYLCLEQPLGALAAGTIFLLADLGPVLATLGNRGYRAAQLEAGIRAGRIYLGAYARDLAATASTFYDDDVTRLVAPGTDKSTLLAAAVGYPAT